MNQVVTPVRRLSVAPVGQIRQIGVIGAGQMGNGIAQVFAAAEFGIVLLDVTDAALQKGLASIDKALGRALSKGKISEADKAATLSRIKLSTQYGAFVDADLVIEAASENEQVKRKIFAELCPVLKPTALIASNTSSISITRLAAVTDRPERFMGMHFMNPVPVMQLVELIRGIATDEGTFAVIKEVVQRLNKIPVAAEDFPGFMVNRILLPMINEAVYTIYEGVGSVDAVDNALKLGAHHPMGPLELADFIGLDTCLAIMQVLHDGLADTKWRVTGVIVRPSDAQAAPTPALCRPKR